MLRPGACELARACLTTSNLPWFMDLTFQVPMQYCSLQQQTLLLSRANSLEKTLMLGKTEDKKRKRWERAKWLDDITNSMGMSLSKLQETVKEREAWNAAVHGVTNSRTWLSDWTTKKTSENSTDAHLPMHLCPYAHSHVVESKEKENLEGSHRKWEIVYKRKGIINKFG